MGGVGFFSGRSVLGQTLPALFHEAHWSPATGTGHRDSAARQVEVAARRLEAVPGRVFLLVNFAATHAPTRPHVPGARRDSPNTQRAALRSVDAALPPLLGALRRRGDTLLILYGDHGTCFGEDGYWGHRLAHPLVWTVPYAEVLLRGAA